MPITDDIPDGESYNELPKPKLTVSRILLDSIARVDSQKHKTHLAMRYEKDFNDIVLANNESPWAADCPVTTA